MLKYYFNRWGRDIRQLITFPFWSLSKGNGPDNHFYKRNRVLKLNKNKKYKNFIETGTFYGQMVNAVYGNFSKILSVELYDKLFFLNQMAYKNDAKVQIFQGDSAVTLGTMIDAVNDSILFWLDGHYSGQGTGIGLQTSPIIYELDIIKNKELKNCCILIDDVRLFNGLDGYPSIEETIIKLKEIDSNCSPYVDLDCLVAIIQK